MRNLNELWTLVFQKYKYQISIDRNTGICRAIEWLGMKNQISYDEKLKLERHMIKTLTVKIEKQFNVDKDIILRKRNPRQQHEAMRVYWWSPDKYEIRLKFLKHLIKITR
jgi:hypothetical protein